MLKENKSAQEKSVAVSALLIIVAWIFISIFFGFGPPPGNPAGWVEREAEQKTRYEILVFAGILISVAFSILHRVLTQVSENVYSTIGITAIAIAAPLFVLNMAFWGNYLTEAFKIFTSSGTRNRPDWYLPIRELFSEVSTIEVALIYIATACFAIAFKNNGWFKSRAAKMYALFSLIGMLLDLIPSGGFEPLKVAGYFVSIPAIPFVMPYLMAIQLLLTKTISTKAIHFNEGKKNAK